MLQLPAKFHHQSEDGRAVTIYQDDAKFWRFYLIPDFPVVRKLPNGDPVFLLIKYAFSDQSREENPELGRGGGYMVFDSELRVEPDLLEEIMPKLEEYVAAKWEELKKRPDDVVRTIEYTSTMRDSLGPQWTGTGHEGGPRASEEVSSTTGLTMPGTGFVAPGEDDPPPPVEIGEPLWKGGKVTMRAPQAPGLVHGMVGEVPASLVGNNVAAFSMDLLPDGATLMQKTLVNPDGSAGTDLTPIQVMYELTMLAKLPPASVYIKFSSAQVYHSMQELFHEHTNCTDDDFTSETMMSTAIESGLLTVKVDMGGVTDEDMQEMLMQQANQQARQLLVDRFAAKERPQMEDWGDDVQGSWDEVYRLKRVQEVEMVDFEQTMEILPTIEYTIAPQATLATFFHETDADMSKFVREIDLDDTFFKTLSLKARAFANWTQDEVSFVEVEVKYEGTDESGESQVKTKTFTFTPDETEPQEWDPSLIGNSREYHYRWRVGFKGREAGEWNVENWADADTATTRNLNIAVETPGKLQVEVTGVGLDFENVLDAVLVHMRYEAPGVDQISNSVVLTAEKRTGTWSQMIYEQWTEPVEYRVEYLLKSGTTVRVPDGGSANAPRWTKTDGPTRNLVIKRPDIDVLDVALVPAGDWTGVIQAALSVRYDDEANDYHRDAQYAFKSSNEFKKWAALLLDPDKRKFKYKVLATFQNGDVQETEWLEREGDQALPVKVAGPPRLTVKVTGAVLDYVSTPLTKVDLAYADPQGAELGDDRSDVASFSLLKPDEVHTWSVPIREGGPRDYNYKITYYPSEGSPVARDEMTTNTELIVVPRYSIPKVGAEVNPVLQNFTNTPGIEVSFTYVDEDRGVSETGTLVFDKKERQHWFVPVPDDAPREYTMTVTWYYADGSSTTSNPVTTAKPNVLLPPAPPPPPPVPAAGGGN